MGRIILAFSHNATRETIARMVERCGHEPWAVCRSGGEALRAARSASGAVSGAVVAGYRLADMTADELVRRLDGDAAALIIASPAHLALVEEPAARKLAAPFSRAALQEALDGLFAPRPRPAPQRTPEETARIQRAKELLIARGLTEPQAHALLQQRSMRNRCRMAQTAEEIIIAYDVNARK